MAWLLGDPEGRGPQAVQGDVAEGKKALGSDSDESRAVPRRAPVDVAPSRTVQEIKAPEGANQLTEHGWLFDAYPKGPRMVVWIKRQDSSVVRLEDDWRHSIYACGPSPWLQRIKADKSLDGLLRSRSIERRFESITDTEKSNVLRLELEHSTRALAGAESIERTCSGNVQLYNVDLLPTQAYFYDHDIFTLAKCSARSLGGRLAFSLQDDQMSTNYSLPEFKTVHLDATVEKNDRLPRLEDRVASISISSSAGGESITTVIDSKSEADALIQFCLLVQKLDPDFVFTRGGDSFLFPYLIHRGQVNNISLVLGREKTPLARPAKGGKTYFSYGRIHYRPTAVKLHGRVHIDTHNSFILDETGLQGLYEVTRLCRMPLHTASRASIGRCMSSLQFYHAWKKGLLIPWKPKLAEHYKTFRQLLIADRGGLIYEPEIGVHENAAEFDFSSLYPSIMLKKNLSGETINCECCPDSGMVVPEVGYHTCRRTGIVPRSLDMILKKRAEYKKLKKQATGYDREVYDSRQTALKWILVTSFGYLGFNNSKFGRIDAHIAVCAYDRVILRQATRTAERAGFRVLHGIVDSLWVKKAGANRADYMRLKDSIETDTGFDISFEGEYRWVAFLPSKVSPMVPVPNRYFGLFEDGKIKVRGIEARRHDTPTFFVNVQAEVLKKMSEGLTIAEVRSTMPEVDEIFAKRAAELQGGRVPLEDLIFTKQISKNSSEYAHRRTVEVDAIRQLEAEGRPLRAGEVLRYIITDYYTRHGPRSVPEELIDLTTQYDTKRYTELLVKVCDSVTIPFGHSVANPTNGVRQDLLCS